jgi:hypothetical protein
MTKTSEHARAKAWRLARGLSVRDLADLTGYSQEAVYQMERGVLPVRKGQRRPQPIKEWAWLRYRNCCAGVDRQINGKQFDWGN